MAFFMDSWQIIVYSEYMLKGIRIYSSDAIWRHILADFNATVLDAPTVDCVDFDALGIKHSVSVLELKSRILKAADNTDIIRSVFGRDVVLPSLAGRIIVCLYRSGGMSVAQLNNALGYNSGVTTHAIDAAIYNLRKLYGHDFIQNQNGIYRLGKL